MKLLIKHNKILYNDTEEAKRRRGRRGGKIKNCLRGQLFFISSKLLNFTLPRRNKFPSKKSIIPIILNIKPKPSKAAPIFLGFLDKIFAIPVFFLGSYFGLVYLRMVLDSKLLLEKTNLPVYFDPHHHRKIDWTDK
jgi:hypothetical protein